MPRLLTNVRRDPPAVLNRKKSPHKRSITPLEMSHNALCGQAWCAPLPRAMFRLDLRKVPILPSNGTRRDLAGKIVVVLSKNWLYPKKGSTQGKEFPKKPAQKVHIDVCSQCSMRNRHQKAKIIQVARMGLGLEVGAHIVLVVTLIIFVLVFGL